MTETKSVRVPEDLHSRLKRIAEEENKSISEAAEEHLGVTDRDDGYTLSEAESAVQNQAVYALKHVVLGECDDPEHEEIRQALGLSPDSEVGKVLSKMKKDT